MYSFEPYVSSSEIEEIIGFQSSQITGTDNENLEQLLFVKNNEVVCNIIGYPENLKLCWDNQTNRRKKLLNQFHGIDFDIVENIPTDLEVYIEKNLNKIQ